MDVIAVSSDDRQRAQRSHSEWPVDRVTLGFGIDSPRARMGSVHQRRLRSRHAAPVLGAGGVPGEPDNIPQYAAITSMPFGRPRAEDLPPGIDYLRKHPDTTFGRA
ncbi:MAG: hypothetical protein JF886_10400 [Candidatus Dormibacteraeota bacterium]|uniref:Uncharacterized protein n=1 Tax=Candidatus Aeolococcus gillhamiae TaxID=3127015 RepID=A0A934N435_9BACT|nr:hypothetical protein [Candidatus Dormibacteraeota bacterium]